MGQKMNVLTIEIAHKRSTSAAILYAGRTADDADAQTLVDMVGSGDDQTGELVVTVSPGYEGVYGPSVRVFPRQDIAEATLRHYLTEKLEGWPKGVKHDTMTHSKRIKNIMKERKEALRQ